MSLFAGVSLLNDKTYILKVTACWLEFVNKGRTQEFALYGLPEGSLHAVAHKVEYHLISWH
jgi:hypothetical protein